MFYPARRFTLSFELFPPKTAAGEASLYENVQQLMAFRPGRDHLHVRRGRLDARQDAGDRAAGAAAVRRPRRLAPDLRRLDGRAAARATCSEARGRGIENIVALRGDPPKGETAFQPVEGGLRYASELVALIRREFPKFGIAVAGYPETHQEATSPQADLENLKRKVEAGGHCVITQLFYSNADFFRFRDRCQELGIRVPIVPGILPVTNLAQIQRITSLCKACLPDDFVAELSQKRRRRLAIRRRRAPSHAAGPRADRRRRARHPLLRAQQVAGDGRGAERRAAAVIFST